MRRSIGPVAIPRLLVVFAGLWSIFWMPDTSFAMGRGSWEIGMDAGGEFATRKLDRWFHDTIDTDGNPITRDSLPELKETVVQVPQGSFRAGYFFTDALSLESTLGLSWTLRNPDTAMAALQVRTGLGVTYAVAPSARVSPFLSSGMSFHLTNNLTTGIPIEAGVRIRVGGTHTIRIQSGGVASFTQSGPGGTDGVFWTVPVRIGWSVNTATSSEGSQP